jgi:hypothetical protein
MAHSAQPHGTSAVVSLRVFVSRAALTWRRRGVWTCAVIAPVAVQAINVVGLIGRAAA